MFFLLKCLKANTDDLKDILETPRYFLFAGCGIRLWGGGSVVVLKSLLKKRESRPGGGARL